MDEQKQDDQLEHIYNSSVTIQNVAWRASWERWTIETGSESGSGISVLAAWHDDDDDDDDDIALNPTIKTYIITFSLLSNSTTSKFSLYLLNPFATSRIS